MESAPKMFPNSSKSEHLIKGIKPIMVCVGSIRDFGIPKQNLVRKKFIEQQDKVHDVNYEGDPGALNEKNFLNGGYETYVMSTIDGLDKFSEGLFDCTSLIIAGVDKSTGKNISFLTHQDPKIFLNWKKKEFITHLQKRLFEIQQRCVPGTIDAVVVGGNNFSKKNYNDSIELISSKVGEILGFEPVVVNGPKLPKSLNPDDVFYENETRRVYLIRPKVNPNIAAFTKSETR